jgi:hypothetical protein
MNIISNFIDEYSKELFELDINILLLFFINYLCFERNIYSHQLVSIFMDIITLIISLFFKQKINILKIILFIIGSYTYCFSFVLIKYINTIYFINIYLLGSLIGIPGLIQFYRSSFFKDINEHILICVLLFILLVFHNFIYFVVIFKIGVIVAIIPKSIVSFITEIIKGKPPIYEIILIVLFFISCLIYLEILELKFWGLNKNITKNIIKRGNDEMNIDLTMSVDSITSIP